MTVTSFSANFLVFSVPLKIHLTLKIHQILQKTCSTCCLYSSSSVSMIGNFFWNSQKAQYGSLHDFVIIKVGHLLSDSNSKLAIEISNQILLSKLISKVSEI